MLVSPACDPRAITCGDLRGQRKARRATKRTIFASRATGWGWITSWVSAPWGAAVSYGGERPPSSTCRSRWLKLRAAWSGWCRGRREAAL